jgi:hypothetical protein
MFAPIFSHTVMIGQVGVKNVRRNWFLYAGNKACPVLEKMAMIGGRWARVWSCTVISDDTRAPKIGKVTWRALTSIETRILVEHGERRSSMLHAGQAREYERNGVQRTGIGSHHAWLNPGGNSEIKGGVALRYGRNHWIRNKITRVSWCLLGYFQGRVWLGSSLLGCRVLWCK